MKIVCLDDLKLRDITPANDQGGEVHASVHAMYRHTGFLDNLRHVSRYEEPSQSSLLVVATLPPPIKLDPDSGFFCELD